MTQEPTNPKGTPTRRARLIPSVILALIGLIIGLIPQSECGSVLFPGRAYVGCYAAVGGAATWMWLLLGLAAFGVLYICLTDLARER